ncbi:macrophage mannose receptor 1-like [Plakobranchus ocellatus]|uniref:Macrophage mannose receptor 1-like n=1 Tax=Plakobranchus ocellatus TaxID=259542 RepID=A0AAV3YD64_9GAST|nr:macrophage mannose receptor 1-like [Plakobranchus ocellatus]
MSGSTYRRSVLITALVGQCCVLVLWTLLVMASSGEAVASSNDCLPGWLKAPSSGTCVRFFEYPRKSWQDARAACQQHGGDLVTIRDARMNAFLTKHFRAYYCYGKRCRYHHYYIGLHDKETEITWRWLNETETATYTNWGYGQPNNLKFYSQKYDQDCAELYRHGRWNDIWCDRQQAYICERPPSSAAPGECEPEWFKNPSSGTCKHWYAERKSWKDAKAFCRQQGGDLVTILDGQTNKFVDELRTSEKGGTCWIGLNDLSKEGEFVWPNNQKVTYKNWDVDPRKTNRNGIDCVVMGYRGTEKWSLFYCKEESSFICEKKGVCPTVDGVCPAGWSKGVSSCFKMYELRRDWKEARTVCQKDGGDLLTIRDECMTHHLEGSV